MRKLVIGEHRNERRRASWRSYYRRNAPKIRKQSGTRYWANREHCLAKKASYRRKQFRNVWGHRQVSEQEWRSVRDFYQSTRAMGNAVTFRQLAARFMVSPRRIQRRSSKDGGWALRATT